RERGRPALASRDGDRPVVQGNAREQPDRASLPQGRAQRRLRRPGRPPGARRQRDAPLLHDGGGPGGEEGVPREAQAQLLALQAAAVNPWVLAARPATLTAALAPVVVGATAAWASAPLRAGATAAALLGAILIQIGTNLANDVFDHE